MILHTLMLLFLAQTFIYAGAAFSNKLGSEYRLVVTMLACGVFFHFVSLFVPLQNAGWLYLGILFLALLGRKNAQMSKQELMCLLCASVTAGFILSTATKLGDTGVYHQQAIRWLVEYGTVTGIAALIDPLGNASSWFALSASLSPFLETSHVGAIAGGLATTSILYSLLIRLSSGDSLRTPLALTLVLILALNVGLCNSPSPDLPLLFVPILIFDLLLKKPQGYLPVSFLLACLLFSVKLVAGLLVIPLLLLSVLNRNHLSIAMGLAIILMTGFIGYKLSNCAYFPLPYFCSQDAHPRNQEIAKYNSRHIRIHAMTCGTGVIQGNWLWPWAKCSPISALLVIGCLLSLMLNFRFISRSPWELWLVLCCIFLFFLAPSCRYAGGFWAFFCAKIAEKLILTRSASKILAILIVVYFCLYTLTDSEWKQAFWMSHQSQSLRPALIKLVSTFPKVYSPNRWDQPLPSVEINGHKVYLRDPQEWDSDGDFCYDSPLPCTWPQRLREIEFIDAKSGCQAGFRWKEVINDHE